MSGMEVALALPGLIDLCITYGKELLERVRIFRDAHNIIEEEGFLLQGINDGIREILSYFQRHLTRLDEEFTLTLTQWCRKLEFYICNALDELPKDAKLDKLTRAKFAVAGRKSLKVARENLEDWHTRFFRRALTYKTFKLDAEPDQPAAGELPSDFAKMHIASKLTVKESTLRLRLDKLDGGSYESIEGCSLQLYTQNESSERLAVEYRYHKGDGSTQVEELGNFVAEIASKLSQVDPMMTGVLRCKGFFHDVFEERYSLRFDIPAGMGSPKSLRALLSDPRNRDPHHMIKHSLNDRIKLATAIASAVLYMHMCGFVHKNIRPENILIFERSTKDIPTDEAKRILWPYAIGTPFLVGYDGVRRATAGSQTLAVRDPKQRIYLAPGRLRMKDNERFHMRHDVYSLGVVLLEIATWSDFTNESSNIARELRSTNDMKKVLLARSTQIPRLLGEKYYAAVKACLTELEEERSEHLLDDQNGLVQGQAYIEKVIEQLEQISI